MSDDAALAELGRRVARYRLNRNMTQMALAHEAGVSTPTIQRIEYGQSTQTANLIRILRVLGLLENLDALIPGSVPSPIQQAKLHGQTRQRASSPIKETSKSKTWSWGN
jgi:transcriptional regulator with XRE-family HTH domain